MGARLICGNSWNTACHKSEPKTLHFVSKAVFPVAVRNGWVDDSFRYFLLRSLRKYLKQINPAKLRFHFYCMFYNWWLYRRAQHWWALIAVRFQMSFMLFSPGLPSTTNVVMRFLCVLTHVLNTFENAEWKMQQLYGAVLLKTTKSCLFLSLLDHTLSPKCSILFTFKASELLLHAPVFVHRQLWWAGGFNSLHTDHRCFKRAIHISQLTLDREANPYSQPDTLPLVGRNSVHN